MDYKEIITSICPSEWKVVSIEDIAKIKGGKRLPKGAMLTKIPTSHPYLRVVDFKDGGIDETNLLFVPDDIFPKIKRYVISKNDIYISIVGTIGIVGKISQKLDGANLTENAAKICDIDSNVERDYLYAFLRSPFGEQQIKAQTVGSTQPKLALFRIAEVQIPLPPLSEQKAIASILSSLDDKIELNQEMNRTLEAQARAIFKSWFVDFDPVRAKMEGRQPAEMDAATAALFPDAFEDSELGMIPKGWEVKPLDRVAHFLNGLALQKYPPNGDDYLPVIKIAELRRGTTESSGKASINIPQEYIVRDGDVLFSWSGSLTVCVWCGGKGALNQHLFKVTSKDYPKWFYYQWANYHLPDFQAIAASKATTMGHIQRHHLSEALTVIPPEKILQAMDKTMMPLLEKTIATSLESSQLSTLRDFLLPKLMSREIRVKEAEKMVGDVA